MTNQIINFYTEFYGSKFSRYYRRPPGFKKPFFNTQIIVENPLKLYYHVHNDSGSYPCFISTYNYGNIDNLKQGLKSEIIVDRIHFDFDVKNQEAEKIKNKLTKLRGNGLKYKESEKRKLQSHLQYLVLFEEIAKPAIDEAKEFAMIFKKEFGKYPALFFSGFKGCHAYIFFNQLKLINADETIEYFATKIKEGFNYQTMDLSVNKSPLTHLSRVPYSKHQLTDLCVLPFTINDSYDAIFRKIINPTVDEFNMENHSIDLNYHLIKIDKILDKNKIERNEYNPSKLISGEYGNIKSEDHRDIFLHVLGKPVKPYKHYNMYNCPFPDHEDKNPSFMVYKVGYKCLGCNRKGNYWQFLKDYYGWSDSQVKNYLKS